MEKIVGKPSEIIKSIWRLDKDKTYTVEIKNYKRKRSLDSNAYAWVLIGKIADKIGITKEEVYCEFIKDVGQFTIIAVDMECILSVKRVWESKGLGWMTESIGKNRNMPNKIDLMLYYGTSAYTQKNMTRFINYVVDRAKELEIETLPPQEIERLNSLWQN